MTLPASGAISLNQVNVELGLSGTTSINMNQASVRTLFGVPSGAISMSNGYGKSNEFAFTISTNQTNANLRNQAVSAGWNQSTKVSATINSGVYISSNSTGTAALVVNGSFPNGVTLTNNGFIIGMAGNGGKGQYNGTNGSAGGLALSVSVPISIANASGTIGGGGGGGGGGQLGYSLVGKGVFASFTGGGGGGGRSSNASNSSGGATGNFYPGASNVLYGTAGGTGTVSSAGGGGAGGTAGSGRAGNGGSGGGWGSAGSGGGAVVSPVGPDSNGPATAGGSGGAATSGSATYITWLSTGTRLGTIG